MLEPGAIVGPYKVETLLGKGGIAAVYKVRHRNLRSAHALKVLFTTDPDSKDRLLREGRVQASLRHPNIVAVTDVMEVDGAPALVMEYVSGPSLFNWLGENRPDEDVALELFRGIVLGLQAAHEAGVVHRDLKPENVLLAPTNDGLIPKVCDFGLVKLLSGRTNTLSGVGFGTPEYMAPEQIQDAANVDSRADLWALGCLLYEIVTGRSAFVADDVAKIYDKVRAADYDDPTRYCPDLDPRIQECIRWLLEVDPDRRIGSAREVFDMLYERSATGQLGSPSNPATRSLDTSASNPPVVRFTSREARRTARVPVSVFGAITVLVALATAGITIWAMRGARPEVVIIEPPPPAPVEAPGDVEPSERPDAVEPEPPAPLEPERPPPNVPPTNAEPVVPEPPPVRRRTVAKVTPTGDAREVVLLGDDGAAFVLPGEVPAGRYDIQADFGEGSQVPAGSVVVLADDDLTLRCSSFVFRCAPVQEDP